MKSKQMVLLAILAFALSALWPPATEAQQKLVDTSSIVDLKTVSTDRGNRTTGKFRVFENRKTATGRQIHLNFVVLHANGPNTLDDPVFFFAGGPGQAAGQLRQMFENDPMRHKRDIVLISQRGTDGDNRLDFKFASEGNTLQQFLDPLMAEATVKRNYERLREMADLRMYSTADAMDDVDDFRKALAYDKINIIGGSYGTRACLVYIRQHGEHVRTATLEGCAPLEFRNPLYHAEGAQRALDLVFDEVDSDDEYRRAFGDLRKKFDEIVERLEPGPIMVHIKNRTTNIDEPISMDKLTFLDAVRLQMYYTGGNRDLPRLLCLAHDGDFRPFVLSSLKQNIALRKALALGMLLSVTAAEDLSRIDPAEIDPMTKDSFFGDARVRSQMNAGEWWPKSELPLGFGDPVRSDVQTLLLSGMIDPVTPPKWGALIQQNFPNSVHVVVPTAHDISGDCVNQIRHQFLDSGKAAGLNLDCVSGMKLPRFKLPSGR